MKINKGDTIGIIALSGDCDREKIELAKSNIERLGYNVILSENIYDKSRYLAGYDEIKLKELHNFFKNPEIKLILCARGGYGAIRLINKIDYELIKNNPKPFCGYSDVTALLVMIHKNTGMITYHSPMAIDFSTESGCNSKFTTSFFKTVNNPHFEYTSSDIIKEGNSNGIMWGGNLSTIVSLCGIDFLPQEDFIFFTEDVNEPVYKIDKMFQQLLNIERFQKYCKGIVLGDFTDVDNEEWLQEYFEELSQRLELPIIKIEGITHAENKITLPIGINAEINGSKLLVK